jgi:PAS domain-containing protein
MALSPSLSIMGMNLNWSKISGRTCCYTPSGLFGTDVPLSQTATGYVGFVKVTRDITERRAEQDRLLESERRFRHLVQSVLHYAIFRSTGMVSSRLGIQVPNASRATLPTRSSASTSVDFIPKRIRPRAFPPQSMRDAGPIFSRAAVKARERLGRKAQH